MTNDSEDNTSQQMPLSKTSPVVENPIVQSVTVVSESSQVPPVVITPVVSLAASAISELLISYKGYLSNRTTSRTGFQNAALTLSNIVDRILATPTTEVFTVMWDFFVANKTGVLSESIALQGIDVLNKAPRFRTEIIYTLFRMAVNGKNVGDAAKINTAMIQSRLKCSALILFLQDQAAKITTI